MEYINAAVGRQRHYFYKSIPGIFIAMEQLEWIPMTPDFRRQVRNRYRIPLYLSTFMLAGFMALFSVPFIRTALEDNNPDMLWAQLPFTLMGLLIYLKIYRHKRHYYRDYQWGHVVKERVAVTKVFDTPSGINIYWLSSETIKSFVPDPYRLLRKGDVLAIYYLKYSKEYLAYEL